MTMRTRARRTASLGRVTTPRVVLRGESSYGFDTGPYVPVEAAQTAVAAFGFQQRCPYSPPRLGG